MVTDDVTSLAVDDVTAIQLCPIMGTCDSSYALQACSQGIMLQGSALAWAAAHGVTEAKKRWGGLAGTCPADTAGAFCVVKKKKKS